MHRRAGGAQQGVDGRGVAAALDFLEVCRHLLCRRSLGGEQRGCALVFDGPSDRGQVGVHRGTDERVNEGDRLSGPKDLRLCQGACSVNRLVHRESGQRGDHPDGCPVAEDGGGAGHFDGILGRSAQPQEHRA